MPADRYGIVAVPWEFMWQMGCKPNEGRYSDLADNDLEFLAPICDVYWHQ